MLNIIDEFTRECLAMRRAATSMKFVDALKSIRQSGKSSERALEQLERLFTSLQSSAFSGQL
jgi:hypothetical protein